MYQKIRETYPYFECELRGLPKEGLHYTALITEYDAIVGEREMLEKQMTKLEFRVGAVRKEKLGSFGFLVDLWNNGQKENSNKC